MADIKVTLSAITDSFNRELDKAEKKSEGFSKNVTDKLNKIGDASIKLGTTLSVALTGAMTVAAGAAFALAKSVGNTADRLLDLSDITGATTDIIQEYQYVSNQAGVASEAFTNAAEGLVRRLSQVDDEGSRVNDVFKSLGIAIKDTNGDIRNGGELMDQTIMKLADMDNVMRRNAIGSQIFGGAWKDIAPILGNGSAGIQKLKDEAHSLGLVMSNEALVSANKFRAEVDKLSAISSGLTNQLGTKLAPMLSDTIVPLFENSIVPALRKAIEFTGKLVDKFNALDPVAKNTAIAIGAVTFAIGPLLIGLGAVLKLAPLVGSAVALMGGPFTIIATVVAAAAIAIALNWDKIKTLVLEGTVFVLNKVADMTLKMSQFLDRIGFSEMSKKFADAALSMADSSDRITAGVIRSKNELALQAEITKNAEINSKLLAEAGDTVTASMNNQADAVKRLYRNYWELNGIQQVLNGKQITGKGVEQKKTIGSLDRGTTIAIPKIDFGTIFTDAEIAGQMVADSINQGIADVLGNGIPELIGGLAESIGSALATGGNVIEAMGQSLLGGLGSIMVQLGKMAIGAGLAIEAVKKALMSLNPVVAIAAGVALVGIGSAFSAGARNLGGGMGGGANGYSQSMVSYGEPMNILRSNNSSQTINVTGEIVGSGDQLRVILNNADAKASRIR